MESHRRTSLKEIGTSQELRQRKSDYGENPTASKPTPVITCNSQAQDIAKFAHGVTYEDLAPERRERLKVTVLDFACAISALGVPPITACLEQTKQFGGLDPRWRPACKLEWGRSPETSRNREKRKLLSQQLVDERDRDRSFPDRRRYAFDIACTNIPRGKNTGQAGFQQVGPATERPVRAGQLFC